VNLGGFKNGIIILAPLLRPSLSRRKPMKLALLLPMLVCVISIFTLIHPMSNGEGEQNDNEIEALGIGQVVFANSLSVDERTKKIGSQLHF
jgi:hypothetical protein